MSSGPPPFRYVLFPGRHHLLTRFQADYLGGLAAGHTLDDNGEPIAVERPVTVVWAVTSANHGNTRRNPIPYDRREAAIERFSLAEGLRSLVVPVFDTAHDIRLHAGADFPYRLSPDGPISLRLGDAMEFLLHKDYADNWLSESHELFCALAYADWKRLLVSAGFELDPASRAWRNDWIVANRLARCASLETPEGRRLAWPATHVLLVARRPLNT